MGYAIAGMGMAFMAGFCFCWSIVYFREMGKKVTALVPVIFMCIFVLLTGVFCVLVGGVI